MLRATVAYLSRHVIAATALVLSLLALGGSSYAALGAPTNQSNRMVQKSIAANTGSTGGTVRAWAHVSSRGMILGGAGSPKIASSSRMFAGFYLLRWSVPLSSRCATVVSVAQPREGLAYPNGYAIASSYAGAHGAPSQTQVLTFKGDQYQTPLGFDVVVICPE